MFLFLHKLRKKKLNFLKRIKMTEDKKNNQKASSKLKDQKPVRQNLEKISKDIDTVETKKQKESKSQDKVEKKADQDQKKTDSQKEKSDSKETKKSNTSASNKILEETKTVPLNKNQKASDKSVNTEKKDNSINLDGLFAFKMSMTTFYNDKGENVPVTALKYEPSYISQIKTQEKESYQAVQVAFKAQKNKRCSKSLIGHLTPAGFKEGARFVREIRQNLPENIKIGQDISIESLKKGDLVKISSLSKGKGFSGVMKKWNFRGGKASHGSKSHRRTGSIGQHTEPARVMPGRKMPGQYGFKQVSRLKVPVVDVLPEEGIIFVKGPVPGARNTLVSLRKM